MLNKLKISDKFTDLFQMRKQQPKKEEQPNRYVSNNFDESYFDCKIVSSGINTQLIKIQAKIKQTGIPLDQLNCKWYIKSSHDFKQIEGVNSSFYQPCLDDIGSIVCVQIEPMIQGKKYTGITLMKESKPIKTDPELERRLNAFLENGNQVFGGRIETFFSQNPKYNDIQTPFQVKLTISLSAQTITVKNFNGQVIDIYQISEEFPQIDFIKKSFNSILFNFNENESMKLSFHNNFNRDLFAFLIRIIASMQQQNKEEEAEIQAEQNKQASIQQNNSQENPILPEIPQTSVSCNPQEQKIELSQNTESEDSKDKEVSKQESNSVATSNTHLILKIDELQKQIRNFKRKYDDLNSNYNIERNYKIKLQNQIQISKKQFEKYKNEHSQCAQIKNKLKNSLDDIRFYKNQISILKMELKEQQKKRLNIQKQLQEQKALNKQNQLKKIIDHLNQAIVVMKNQSNFHDQQKSALHSEVQNLLVREQKLQNQNSKLKKKLQSLIQEKNIPNSPSKSEISKIENQSQTIKNLEFKILNLQMLLKYQNNHPSTAHNPSNPQQVNGLQQIINKLTENISQKQLQIDQIKKVNKNLLQQIMILKKSGK